MNSFLRSFDSFLAARGLRSPAGPDVEEVFEFTDRMNDTQHLDLSGMNGRVEVIGTATDTIRLKAIKWGSPDEVPLVTIQVDRTPAGFLARVVCPNRRFRLQPNVTVHFEVSLPAPCSFHGRIENGSIRVESISGFVKADTSNGSIEVLNSAWVHANSGNGAIRASLNTLDSKKSILLKTLNGSIRVGFPEKSEAEVIARTRNGRVSSDFPLAAHRDKFHNSLTGRIGTKPSEAGQVVCETRNGSIYINSLESAPGKSAN